LEPESIPVFLDAHENGTENEQYAALLALRLFGCEAWGVGYGAELVYEVKEPGVLGARSPIASSSREGLSTGGTEATTTAS